MTCLLAVLAMLIAASPSALAAPGHSRADFSTVVAHGEGEAQGVEALIDSFGEMHPAFVHFPIALILAAALAEALALTTRRPMFAHAARYSVVIAALGAIAAVPAGWIAGAVDYGTLAGTLATHRWLGIVAGIVIIGTAVLSEAAHRRNRGRLLLCYRIALVAGAFLVVLTAYFGGKLVHG